MARGSAWGLAGIACLASGLAMVAYPLVIQEEPLSEGELSLPDEMTFDSIRRGPQGGVLTLRTPSGFSGSLDIYSIGDLSTFPWTLEGNVIVTPKARISMGFSMSDPIFSGGRRRGGQRPGWPARYT